jgi:leucyl aminopeptidase
MAIAIELIPSLPAGVDAVDAVGVGVFSDDLDGGPDTRLPDPLDAAFLAAQGFKAKPGETCAVPGPGGQLVVALGLGPRGEATHRTFRKASAALARAARRRQTVATTLLDQAGGLDGLAPADVARSVAEGALLGAYTYTALKSDPEPSRIDSLGLVAANGADGTGDTDGAIARSTATAAAVCLARDLVNEPGGSLTPRVFAERAVGLGADHGFQVEVLDREAIVRERLGGLLGVNRGSDEEPRFLKLEWQPGDTTEPTAATTATTTTPTVALVGKGITFDSGGLSLKSTDSMIGMKGDMAGAAAVLATFTALDTVRPPVRVLGYLPLTDNMPGGDATRIGDVLRIRNGKTVEILNTDAEGRLVLADGLSLASEDGADAIVDLATLTGACMVALGARIAGLMGNDEGLIDQVRAAADAAGEDVWPLPLPDDLRPQLDSDVADLKNVSSGRWGGALVAGLFLKEFVADGTAWAHLDIAGPADALDEDAETRKGGTGFGVRTLLQLLTDFRRP